MLCYWLILLLLPLFLMYVRLDDCNVMLLTNTPNTPTLSHGPSVRWLQCNASNTPNTPTLSHVRSIRRLQCNVVTDEYSCYFHTLLCMYGQMRLQCNGTPPTLPQPPTTAPSSTPVRMPLPWKSSGIGTTGSGIWTGCCRTTTCSQSPAGPSSDLVDR